MSAPDLSVVIVSYNTCSLLESCLRSLSAAASPLGLQSIVVDNGSTDGSRAMVVERFPETVWIDNPGNPGFAHATNRGLERADGRYWIWLNSDCECPPGSLAALVLALDSHPEVGVVGPRLADGSGRQQPSAQAFPGVSRVLIHFLGLRSLLSWTPLRRLLTALSPMMGSMSRGYLAATEAGADERLVDWVSGACLVARADAARAAGPLDETFFMYCEDTDWCHRMHDLGWAILWCPKVTVVHHVGGSASGSPFVTYQHYRSLLLYFARYEPHAIARLRVFMLVGCVPRALAAECRRLFGGGEHPWWRILRLSLQRASTWGAGA